MRNEIFKMSNIVKTYQMGEESSTVLKEVSLTVYEGEFLAILGPSGSGKTTLMNIIGCLDIPTSGEYILSGKKISEQDEKTLAKVRREEIGFIFQSFHLLPKQSALKNVALPLIYAGVKKIERLERAEKMPV
ncbi:MAG TPA: ATP-binding cassette domain-containing protein, partial [Anaerovoracaceae bacterium]|nr:ATP-binding cassette domain-containing protein [Anaerovoracaceae bacterium]